MKTEKNLIPDVTSIVIIAAMFATSLAVWNRAPDEIPVHWNFRGEPDRWGGRSEGLMLLPLITIGLFGLLKVIPLFDPKKENYAQFQTVYDVIRLSMTVLMGVIHSAIIAWVLGYQINMGTVVSLSVGSLMILLGNFMGKIRPNWFVGIRTPWTFSSKKSWVKTHRFGGWVFILMGLTMMATGFFESEYALMGAVGLILVGALVVVVYSYFVWKHDTDRVPALETSPGNDTSTSK